MFTTLHAALGTWPSEAAYSAEDCTDLPHASGVNETSTFGSDEPDSASTATTSKIEPTPTPGGQVIVPPYSTPPSSTDTARERSGDRPRSSSQSNPSRVTDTVDSEPSSSNGRRTHSGVNSSVQCFDEVSSGSADWRQPDSNSAMEIDPQSRSPSPPSLDEILQQARKAMWSSDSRNAFHEMVTAPGYVNRYRMHMKKRQRLTHYLEHPDLEPHLCDGSKDHQTKYQAVNWTLVDGKLCRKPESGRVGTLRSHLDEVEAWEVLTAEHLRSGHAGRDRLRKVLERRYIGYTLQEIMFVLKECNKCARRETAANPEAGANGAATNLQQPRNAFFSDTGMTDDSTISHPSAARKTTSNFMLF
ncbi:hypothetical protein LTR37_016941 [Vermiconidia calcicola]|uniref:Uncharacterized protein n=1 Tax=Vermiconidia calcicola TaxID=1690605 RepID=A0ACC3MLR6_9PEZI|nr:hypothetical protein LTR37_016941 [Vermiconidia calcicola]